MGGGGTIISIMCNLLNDAIVSDVQIMGLDIGQKDLSIGIFFILIALIMVANFISVM